MRQRSHPESAFSASFSVVAACACAAIAGCSGMHTSAGCPDISGRYVDQADGDSERLTSLLLDDAAGPNPAKTVSLSLDRSRHEMRVTVGAQHKVLKEGSDFVCDVRGVRLVEPVKHELDLGEMLVHQVSDFHTFGKAPDGALVAIKSSQERATIANIPLSGPERQGAMVRWRPAAGNSAR